MQLARSGTFIAYVKWQVLQQRRWIQAPVVVCGGVTCYHDISPQCDSVTM